MTVTASEDLQLLLRPIAADNVFQSPLTPGNHAAVGLRTSIAARGIALNGVDVSAFHTFHDANMLCGCRIAEVHKNKVTMLIVAGDPLILLFA